MHKKIGLILTFLFAFSTMSLNAKPNNESVILLHGLGDVKLSMLKLESALKDEGYTTINIGYSSTGETIESLAEKELSTDSNITIMDETINL